MFCRIQAGWTDKDVYGKHSSQLYGTSQVSLNNESNGKLP